MDRRLKKIRTFIEKEFSKDDFFIWDEKKWEAVEVFNQVNFAVDKGEFMVSFYSGLDPVTVGWYIRVLHSYGITEFVIMENIYPKFNDNGEFEDMLFGDEADQKFRKDIYEDMKKKIDFIKMIPTAGMKQ